MADNEKKTEAVKAEKAKDSKPEKVKEDKPSLFERLGVWFKSIKSECKKISWASWKSVKSNSIVVLVCVIIFAIALGILDYCFSSAIVGLSRLI